MILRFDEFELDQARYELRRAGVPVPVERRVFDLIAYLARNAERVVTKAEIFDRVWSGRVVAEGSLTVAMSAARRALGDDAAQQAFIRTHPGRGYRFIKPIAFLDRNATRTAEASQAAGLLGRSGQLRAFVDIIDSDVNHSSILLLSGEPGIGKSRLVTEYTALASARGLPTHLARCPESERTPFLWPCQQIIRKLAAGREDSLSRLVPNHQARFLSSLLPDLFPGETDHFSSDPDAARFQLFEAMTLLLRVLCTESRHILAIDDFHRADDGTARFLPFAAMELRDVPLILLITYRPVEASLALAPASGLAALAREPNATHLVLEGISPEDTYRLASALSETPLPEATAHELHARTGGNPFFIRQLLPLLHTRPTSGPSAPIPPSISLAIDARISILSEPTQSLLSVAAAFGRDFDISALAAASGATEVDQSLQEAIDAGLLAMTRDKNQHASFLHILVRDVLYSRLPLSRRRNLHLRIGQVLDSDGAELAEDRASEIARHYLQSGDQRALARAVDLGERAGVAACRRAAHEDARHHFAVALEALSLLDQDDRSRRCHLLLSLGEALCRAGDRSTAKATFREAAVLAATLGASEDLARAALGVAPGILAAEAGVVDASLEQLLMDAMRSLDESAVDLRALLASRLAMAILWSERDSTVQELMEMARSCLARSLDPNVRLHVLFAEWFCGWDARAIDERHALAEEIQAIADRIHNREMTVVGMVLRMLGMLERGEMSSFDSALLAFDDLARLLRQPQSLWYASMYKGMRALVDGRLDDAAGFQKEFAGIAARVNDANAFHSLAAQAGLLHWERGTLESVLGTLEEGVRQYPAIRGFRAGLAWSLIKIGRERDSAHEFEILAANEFRDLPQRYDWSSTVSFASDVCAVLGDQRRAKVLYHMLEPYGGRVLVLGLGTANFGAADRLLGLLAATLGQTERAEWHFERALEVTGAAMPAWNGHTKVDYARFQLRCRRTGGRRAAQLAAEARTLARSLNMKTLEERANAVLQHRDARSLF